MSIEITRLDHRDPDALARYWSVPMSLTVRSILDIEDAAGTGGEFGGLSLREVPVGKPWLKDYLAGDYGPESLQRFTCAHNSTFLLATEDDVVVGAASGIRHCADAEYFCTTDGRPDVAVLRDIRVAGSALRNGVGRRLFESVSEWAKREEMRFLKIETQNTNVPACRFYHQMGAVLGGVQRHAYGGENADEVMLLWYKEL